jgi:carbohydrate kinase (thermoresistant glucokinase family)
MNVPRIVIVMGVSGSGKTTLGAALAEILGATYLEADRFHPPANIAHMAAGKPLDDAMRWPWLKALARAAAEAARTGPAVASCSALKRSYRDLIRAEAGPVRFLFLDGRRAVLEARVRLRQHDYMPATLLDSQLATLEPPGPDEPDVIRLDLDQTMEAQIARSLAALATTPAKP